MYWIVFNKIISGIYEDSNKIVIEFGGTVSKVTYKGNTIYYKATKTGTYSIEITVDSITVNTDIYWDRKDSLIKTKTYADGKLIGNAVTTVDNELYKLIRKKEIVCPDVPYDGIFDKLFVYGELESNFNTISLLKIRPKIGFEYINHRWLLSIDKNE